MNIDEAKTYLKASTKPEYHAYIDKQLAGDFAVTVAEKLSVTRGALKETLLELEQWNLTEGEDAARTILKNGFELLKT